MLTRASEPELHLAYNGPPEQVAEDVLLDSLVEQVGHLHRRRDGASLPLHPAKLPFTVAYPSV